MNNVNTGYIQATSTYAVTRAFVRAMEGKANSHKVFDSEAVFNLIACALQEAGARSAEELRLDECFSIAARLWNHFAHLRNMGNHEAAKALWDDELSGSCSVINELLGHNTALHVLYNWRSTPINQTLNEWLG
jgi:small basic protein